MSNLERELKLMPRDPVLLEQLALVDRLGELEVNKRERELQRNSFFDTPSKALGRAQVSFRRRTILGQSMATWTLKAEGETPTVRGIATRTEIEVHLDPQMSPVLALDALRSAARQRGAAVLAELLDDALAGEGLPAAQPFLETETDRLVVDLVAEARGWSVEMALDRVRLIGHSYSELEIEVELKRGDEAALEAAREAIEAIGPVQESEGSKLGRALAHMENCHRRVV
jgi:inorganic triphosphatase YgiF